MRHFFWLFLKQIRSYYDVILIDTPPVLVVPDARVIGHMVDAVIYSVHWNRTARAQLLEGLNALSSVDIHVSGLSLSQIDLKQAQSYYGGKYGYGGYYGYGKGYYTS